MIAQGLSFSRRAARHLNIERLIGEILQRNQFQDAFPPFGHAMRIRQTDAIQAELQTMQVRVEPERFPRIHGHQFVNAVAEHETAVEHRHLRLGERQEPAVQVDVHFANSSRNESQMRPNRPATRTLCMATSGYSLSGLPSSVSRKVPRRCPLCTGAMTGCSVTTSALTRGAAPRGTSRWKSCSNPRSTDGRSPR